MKFEVQEIEERRHAAACGCPLARVVRAMAVLYLAAMLLNAGALERTARRLQYGPVRTFWLGMTRPLLSMSRALRLTALRTGVEHAAGGGDSEI